MARRSEVINGDTGEVEAEDAMHAGMLAKRREDDEFDRMMAQAIKDKDLLARTKAAETAKPDTFKASDADFWKPTEEGEELRGVYMGAVQGARYLIHHILKVNAKGKPYAVRINGTSILTRELKKREPGTAVRIVFTGKTKTDEGNPLNEYEVTHLED